MSRNGTVRAVYGMIGLATVGALALTGCGPDETTASNTTKNTQAATPTATTGGFQNTLPTDSPTTAPAAPSQSAPTTAPTTAAPSTAAPAPAGDGTLAKAGQSFKVGQTAQLPFTYGDTKGTIALTVTAIEAGNPADLAPLKLGDQAAGKIPYYIRYSVKNVGNTDLSFSTVDHVTGLLPDGTQGQDVMLIGTFDKCSTDALPSGFTNGKTAQGCALVLAPSASTKITAAEYWGDPFTLDQGLTWK
ncbi:hypothetical protein OG455_31005 [Kitasatospora sp. NBC_01287]|uniref:hypothetical protein n=1 Tax=Kitasatospora sp. NBC_01287 TaxID=2903573 RepID=UPI0022525C80|nr:hypothetical protein [Kitasatospora sp. NBC_01287]MCX4749894.1 hypothetical protein [Kitasatospora sp. NBC_01287]